MTATIPAKTDPLAALQRADERWCKRRPHYEPAEPKYLQALAAAVEPLLQPAVEVQPPDPAVVAERDQLKDELAKLQAAHAELARVHGEKTRALAQAQEALAKKVHDRSAFADEEQARALAAAHRRAEELQEQRDDARIDRVAVLRHLNVLVEAITEQPLPAVKPGRPEVLAAAVSRAELLVQAAHANLLRREESGQHIHTFSLTPCACGEEIPPPKGRR